MGAQKAEQADQQTTLVVETLEQVAAASVRRLVLRRALEVARLDGIPRRVEELTFFVSGPLYEAAQSVLGEDFADELLLELAPVLDRAWHEDRATVAPPSVIDTTQVESDHVLACRDLAAPAVDGSIGAPHSNVRKKSAIQRVGVDAPAIADTVPAADEDDTGPMAVPSPDVVEGIAADTIPGTASGRPADSGRGAPLATHDWTFTDTPPASSNPGALAPPSAPDGAATVESARSCGPLMAVAVATRDETPPPPRSSRFTVPYLQAVLIPPRRRRRVMIVDAHQRPRRELAAALEERGYAVVTAHDRSVARTLFHRLAPTLIIADVETIAPDFEPLGPAFETLLGLSTASQSSRAGLEGDHALAPPRVLLLSDGATRSIPPEVDCVVDRGTDPSGILHEVSGLLPLESRRQL